MPHKTHQVNQRPSTLPTAVGRTKRIMNNYYSSAKYSLAFIGYLKRAETAIYFPLLHLRLLFSSIPLIDKQEKRSLQLLEQAKSCRRTIVFHDLHLDLLSSTSLVLPCYLHPVPNPIFSFLLKKWIKYRMNH